MKNKHASIKQRIIALLIDYFVILAYIIILFIVNLLFIYFILDGVPKFNRTESDLIAFLLLIFPVLLYLISTEYGRNQATIGKRKMNIYIAASGDGSLTLLQVIIRNCVKLLPWQLAHTAIFTGRYNDWEMSPLMIVAITVIYGLPILSMILLYFRKDHRTIHDFIADTNVLSKE